MAKRSRPGVARERSARRERMVRRGPEPGPEPVSGRERTAARLAVGLSALGIWTIIVPFLGHSIGFGVKVSSTVEVVDHVVPGVVVAAAGGWLFMLTRRQTVVGQWPALVGGGVCALAGFWVLATHVPLLSDAAGGSAEWGTALWHASTALPIVLVSLWFVLQSPESDGPPRPLPR